MSGRPKEGNEAQLEYSYYFFLHAYMYRTYIYIVPTYLSKKECQQTKDDKISATCKVCDLHVHATKKKENCMAIVTMAHIAKLLVSASKTSIVQLLLT